MVRSSKILSGVLVLENLILIPLLVLFVIKTISLVSILFYWVNEKGKFWFEFVYFFDHNKYNMTITLFYTNYSHFIKLGTRIFVKYIFTVANISSQHWIWSSFVVINRRVHTRRRLWQNIFSNKLSLTDFHTTSVYDIGN